jgi:hypothetical protein
LTSCGYFITSAPALSGEEKNVAGTATVTAVASSCGRPAFLRRDILNDYINLDISGRPLPARSKGEFT